MGARAEKARLIVLDCETIATRNAAEIDRVSVQARMRRPANNTKKEIKETWDAPESVEARVAEAVAKTAVDPMLAEILCVCAWEIGPEGLHQTVYSEMPGAVAGIGEMVERWHQASNEQTVWVGHNCEGFDLGVLLNNMRRRGLRPPEQYPAFVRGRWRGRVYDTAQRIPSKRMGFISLESACAALGVPGPVPTFFALPWADAEDEGAQRELEGKYVAEAFAAGKYSEIIRYCAEDVAATYRLYKALTCEDTWGTYDATGGVDEALREVVESDLPAGQKLLALVSVLRQGGKLAA